MSVYRIHESGAWSGIAQKKAIELMAEAEQLRGHAEAVRVRYK